ncbi:PAS domain S-box protein [Methanocella sp. MCL-LM]|uniref:PAS domain-containing protein n=1 Tax=Methanocella sp. MCL-LM TaxID=3412035 RepID=UPI003C73869E
MYQEREVVKDNNFYRYIFENIRDPVLIIRPDGQIIDANKAIAEATGYTKTELLRMNVSDLRPLSGKPKVCEDLDRSREEGVFETTYQRRDGDIFPVEISTQRVVLGDELAFVEIIRDITERKKADESVIRLQATLEKSQEIANLGSWELDLENNRLTWSDEAYRIFGLKPQEFGATYEAFLAIIHPDDRAAVDDAYSSSVRLGKNAYEIDHRILRMRGGEIRYVHEKCEHIRDGSGNITRSVGIVQDITERKRAEEARERLLQEIDEQRNRLKAILDSLPVGVWIADNTGKVILINDIARVIWGGKAPASNSIEDYGQYKFWWSDTGELARAEDMPLARAITHGETRKNVLIDIERFDGTSGTELISGAPIRDSKGEIIGGVVIIQDISELMRTEEELKAAKAQAELYLDLMGHDISNMHQIILMQLELALGVLDEEGKLDARYRDMLDIPLKTLERSVNLIHNVRMLQKVRSGEYRAEPLDLGPVIEEIVNTYSKVPGRNVTINYAHSSGYRVMASPLIKDIVSNLVDNAVKHAQDPVQISIAVDKVEQKGIAYYRVSVEDNGRGIPDEKKDLIFLRFKRGQTAVKGTGLGLYIVRTLVESFDGKVEVEDRIPGDHTLGARFNVYLPVAEAVADER